jgi:hypothetical protein
MSHVWMFFFSLPISIDFCCLLRHRGLQALLETLHAKPNQTYDELITHLRELLVPKYGQKAQFSGSHPMVRRKDCFRNVLD